MVDRCSLSFILNSSSNPIPEEESRPPTPTQKWLQTILSAPSSPLELPGASNAYEAIHRKRKSPCEPEQQQPQHQPLRSNKSRRIGSEITATASAGLVEHIRELTDRAIKATLPNVPLRPQPQPQQPQVIFSTSDVAVCRRNKLLLQQLLNEPFDLIERPADSDNKRRKASVEQAAFLERVFRVEPMPSPVTRSKIAQKIGLTPKRVQIWFQNKRARLKNDNTNNSNTNNMHLAASSTSSSSEDILVSRKGRSDAMETTKRIQQQKKRTVSPTPKQSGCFVFHNLALCGDGQLILRSEGAPPLLLEGSLSRE